MTRSTFIRTAAPALAVAALAGAVLAGPVLASSDRGDDDMRLAEPVPAAEWLSVAEIAQRLETDGRTVTAVEADDGLYEVYFTEGGVRYEAKVHPRTAEILEQERD